MPYGDRVAFDDGNFERIGAIRAALPNAKIVLCERDPIDNCLSMYRQNFAVANEFTAESVDSPTLVITWLSVSLSLAPTC